ncbi:MAG TPA: dihydrolipoamide acetyltransferase family protein [Microlunatus sp.]|nr:dihydrolipoamide acetyltransferase family protein [Microlunatus sp.]
MKEFRLPDPGEGLVEADIVTWRVAVGDAVKINDILVEIETSKSLVELPSPFEGTITDLLVAEGDTVDVGVPIIAIDDGQDAPAPSPAAPAGAAGNGEDGAERVANLVGYGAKQTETRRRPRKAVSSEVDPVEAHEQVASTFATDAPVSRRADEREPLQPAPDEAQGSPLPVPGPAAAETVPPTSGAILAKPPVRKLARDLEVDLATVSGTGTGGVITRSDVEAAARPTPEPAGASVSVATTGEDRRIPIKGVRKATAAAMVQSAFTAPHVTVWVETDVTATMDLVATIRGRKEFRDVKVSPLLIVAKAALIALHRHPQLNSSWDEAAQEIVLKGSVNLGIAAATPRGLIVPNIKNADRLSLLELAQAFGSLVTLARSGKTPPEDMARGSFTITNIGVFGVDGGLPILNPGEAGILAIGQIVRKPWVLGSGESERIEPRWVTTVAVSFDHRLADGEQGSQFLADIAQILSDPGLALVLA